ncbi:NAD(P)/FAD-dependent oxidoreductase [Brevundimonas sp. SORGH_AS_0993]|uniref:NAD(P)/FAD-dependent oxidoreductase n=1 Tax=Brevundimonas sp. SORGH_AS_0993 TaxID=3041794 RepID=UPI00278A8AC5|nr:FAD/NAD(P)-binding oxidoreductase [Brevundimonas sp. SORGH_AS_0993]MDQ1153637.1 3-phenylpropionate/trans-cinnamate dioxygenase ferredoxin reductase subunit [Brevundimonas sp. SORGH_AS_0993]
MERFDVLIVGAGHGGGQAALQLRQEKFEGSIALLGDEPWLPYDRPAMSKDYLSGAKPFDRLGLRPASAWAERDIALRLGRRAVAVDAQAHQVTTSDGAVFGYGRLIWAAGASPRRLACPGAGLGGVHVLRGRADVDAMRDGLDAVTDVVIVGGGYIGLEAAAALVKADKRVTVIEAQDRLLARTSGQVVARVFETVHRAHGVDFRFGRTVEALEGLGGVVDGVLLSGGERIKASMVIVGIGVVPNVKPLLEAGAAGGDGVLVDEFCRTSLADVFAIGDCAKHVNPFGGAEPLRLECVQNAHDQAQTVTRHLAGRSAPYEAVPWFWSNQYDLRLQAVGLSTDHDDVVVRGDPDDSSFSVVYLRQGRVVALDCVNAVKDYVQGRVLVVAGARIDPSALADATTPLKLLHSVAADAA